MIKRYKPAQVLLAFLAGAAGLLGASVSRADTPWADSNYKYRRPLNATSNVAAGLNTGDVVAFPYVPNYGPFLGKTRSDGKDVKVFYFNGSTNTEANQVILPMGPDMARILFALQAPVPAPGAYAIHENASAGNTGYDSLPKGPALVFPSSADHPLDDNAVTVTLPFTFALRDQSSNKITIAIDGYFGVGSVDPGRPDATDTGATKYIVMPFQTDWAISGGEGQGVYFSADSTQAVIKWEVQASTGTVDPIIAKFACVIKPDGSIRFVYGNPCEIPAVDDFIAAPDLGYDPIRYGVGVNQAGSPITGPAWDPFNGVVFTGHADVLYTQDLPMTQVDGYWLYYGNATDTGTRTAPTSGLQGCDFSDGQLHGWKSLQDPAGTGGASSDCRINTDATYGSELRTDGSKYHHPFSFWDTMTPVANGLLYTKARCSSEFGFLQRFNTQTLTSSLGGDYLTGADAPGAGVVWSSFGGVLGMAIDSTIQATEEGTTGRRHPGPDALEPGVFYKQNDASIYQYSISATVNDTASGHTLIKAKAWPSAVPTIVSDPGAWLLSRDTNLKAAAYQPLPAGKVAVTQYFGTVFTKWVYIVSNPYAEDLQYSPGAEVALPPPAGKGIIQGTVQDAATTAFLPGATITATPTGGGAGVVATTDNLGHYQAFVDPGTYNVQLAATDYTSQTKPSGTVASGASVTVNAILVAPNLVFNPGMEIEDTVANGDPNAPTGGSNVKPLGWYRRTFDGVNPDPNHIGVTGTVPSGVNPTLWVYNTTSGANVHSGTHSVGILGGSTATTAWDSEGSVAGSVNADQRNLGPAARLTPGIQYLVTAWVKKIGNLGGTARLRSRDITADNDNITPGAGIVLDVTGDTGGWVQLSSLYTSTSGYLSSRGYGLALKSGEEVYWDDFSVTRVTNPVFTGQVLDSSGAPVPGAIIGIREAGAGGLACSLASASTDAVGRFTVSFLPSAGTSYVVQAWKDGYGASANAPLLSAAETTIVTYDPKAYANLAAGKAIAASSGDDNGGGKVANAVDGNEGTRWINGTSNPVSVSTGSTNPAWIVVDLGLSASIKQVSLIWENAKPASYQIRVSDTAPTAGFTAAAAAAYGTLVYDTTTGTNTALTTVSGQKLDVLAPPSISGAVSGRYVEVYMSKFGPFANHSLWEMKVEVPIGSVTGRAIDAVTLQPIANAFVGPYPFIRIRPWNSTIYVKTDANGVFTYNGASIPLQLATHKTDDSKKTDVEADPYLVKPLVLTPSAAGTNAGDILLQPNSDAGGSAFVGGTSILIDNSANPGTDTYQPSAATNTGNSPNLLPQLTDGDPSLPWDINSSDVGANGKIHSVTTGTGYLRWGYQTTLATPANLSGVDMLWWQNGYPLGYYVEIQRPSSSTWERVYTVNNQEAGYGTKDDSGNDAWTVNPIWFSPRPVAKLRVIFTLKSNRSYGADPGESGTEVLIGEMVGISSTAPSVADAVSALRVAGGLDAAGSAFNKLNTVTTGTSAGKVDVIDAITLLKKAQ